MDKVDTNVKCKQGVKKLFMILILTVMGDEKQAKYRNADYKKFLKFIDIAYESVALKYEKNILSKIDTNTFENVVARFEEICRDISYDNFSKWIGNNKDVFSLYNINEKSLENKELQISFYARVMQVMYYIYESLNYDSYGIIKSNYDKSQKIYELMKNNIRNGRCEITNEYANLDILELKEELKNAKVKEKQIEKYENVSYYEVYEKIYSILLELLNHRSELLNSEFNKYYKEKNAYWLKIRKIKNVRLSENYRSVVRRDVLLENIEKTTDDDPTHNELISKCITQKKDCRIRGINANKQDIEKIIDKTKEIIAKEKIDTIKKIQNAQVIFEIIDENGNKNIQIEKIELNEIKEKIR